jgi:predicted O-methyltransferase YrrM
MTGDFMARTFQHWSIRYLLDRSFEKAFRRTHPGVPWVAPAAVEFLEGYLKPTDRMLEFGSGRSTLWFAERIQHITSVEHNPVWYKEISSKIQEKGITKITYHLHPKQPDSVPASQSDYVQVTQTIPAASLDVCLVDGIYRAQCVLKSIPLIKHGGILIIDNVNRYLPSQSVAPNSRSMINGPLDEDWRQVLEIISVWRSFWTSNGVSDTAIYFKPY